MIHFVQNSELASRWDIWFPDFCGVYLFLDFVFYRETAVASEKGWVWGRGGLPNKF